MAPCTACVAAIFLMPHYLKACLRVRLEAAQLLRQKAPRERLIRSNTVFSQIDTDGELGLGVGLALGLGLGVALGTTRVTLFPLNHPLNHPSPTSTPSTLTRRRCAVSRGAAEQQGPHPRGGRPAEPHARAGMAT